MELGGREILIALGALLVLAILLDGVRRVRNAGRGKLRVKRRRQPIFDDNNLDEFGSELPSGGARVVSLRDEDSAEQLSQSIKESRDSDESRLTAPFRKSWRRQPEQEAMGFGEPNLGGEDQQDFDEQGANDRGFEERSLEERDFGQEGSAFDPEPFDKMLLDEELVDQESFAAEEMRAAQYEDVEPTVDPVEINKKSKRAAPRFGIQVPLFAIDPVVTDPVDSFAEFSPGLESTKRTKKSPSKNSGNQGVKTIAAGDKPSGKPTVAKKQSATTNEDVIVLHLMASEGTVFTGSELLDAVVDNGLRYGALKIFHRHVKADGSGDVLFSMANSVNPGTFELNAMAEFSTPGVTFMMVLQDSDDPLGTFDLMLQSIYGISSLIGGELKDEKRSTLGRQTAEHYRERIMDFNRRRFQIAGV